MKTLKRIMAAALLATVAGLAATPASAAQTVAGTTITNNVTVGYKVNNISQNNVTASNTFTVDRKVNLTVVEDGGAATTVTPGQSEAVTTFLVSNLSNAPIDIALAATNLAGDNFDTSSVKIYADTNASGAYDTGDTEITYLDQVAAETSNLRVFVISDVALGQTAGQVANIRLAGTASEATNAGTLGATITETTGANNVNSVDTVLADTKTSGGNTARDGIDFAQDSYTVASATVAATKTSRIVSDPLNGTTDPKAIPGAIVEYCIAVANSGNVAATQVAITDTLPATTTYDAAFGIKQNGTVTGATCNADGAAGGSYANGVVSGTIATVNPSDTRTVVFRVSIN